MSYRKELYKANGIFFFIGACLYKVQYIPISIPLVASVFKVLALISYFIGYLLWAITYKPTVIELFKPWGWEAKEHMHHILAALIGLVATLFCICSLANPIIGIVGLWFYVVSDLFWCLAEYKTWQDPTRSSSLGQGAYFGYALCLTLIAITVAIMVFFPPGLLTVCITGGICSGIGLFASFFYIQSWEDSKVPVFESSPYTIIGDLNLNTEACEEPRVEHYYSPLHAPAPQPQPGYQSNHIASL